MTFLMKEGVMDEVPPHLFSIFSNDDGKDYSEEGRVPKDIFQLN